MRSSDFPNFKPLVSACIVLTLAVSGCTHPRKTTAIGSGVGGALGAGVGAIVGNQSGNPGSGVAIGAVTGAATGALIANALQAQDEKTSAQNEALKRQEKQLQAQRNELAELRAMNSDSGYEATPRYRYRPTSVDNNSPAVERQMARLQQRGPNPRHPGAPAYQSPRYTSTARSTAPSSSSASSHKVSTHEDVRNEMRREKLPEKQKPAPAQAIPSENAPSSEPKIVASVPLSKERLPDPEPAAKSAPEKDLPADTKVESEPVAKVSAPAMNSAECKEALNEKELALAATENSDKLFHLRRALRLCPNSAPLHYELGNTYAAMERTSNAEEEYKQAVTIDPSMAAAKNALADLLKAETKF